MMQIESWEVNARIDSLDSSFLVSSCYIVITRTDKLTKREREKQIFSPFNIINQTLSISQRLVLSP